MKILNTTLVLFLLSFTTSFSQVLSNVNLNLNTGGEIYDVKYSITHKRYYVVGNFTSIGGFAYKNFAILNEDLTVNNGLAIANVNGPIFCVEVAGNNVYVGGNFTSLNGFACKGLGRINVTVPASPASATVTLASVNWNPLINSIQSPTEVHDMESNGTQIVVTGMFEGFNSGGTDYQRDFIASFNGGTGNLLTSQFDDVQGINFFPYGVNRKMMVKKIGSYFYLIGPGLQINNPVTPYSDGNTRQFILKYTTNGTLLSGVSEYPYSTTINPWGNCDVALDLEPYDDSLALIEVGTNSGQRLQLVNLDTKVFYDLPYYNNNTLSSATSNVKCSEHVNEKVFTFQYSAPTGLRIDSLENNVSFRCLEYKGLRPVVYQGGADGGGALSGQARSMNIQNNHLFISNSKIQQVQGNARTGLAVYCLEPEHAERMNNSWYVSSPLSLDSILCPGNIVRFSLPEVANCNGIKWSTTASGLKYRFPSGTDVNTAPLATTFTMDFNVPVFNQTVHTQTSNSIGNYIWIYVEEGYTGGTITATPYSFCNGTADTLYSKPTTTQLILAPLPNIQIPTEVTINCITLAATLAVSSSSSNVTSTWIDDNNNQLGATITVDESDMGIYDSLYFVARVTQNSSNQCRSMDSTLVILDKEEPYLEPLNSNPLIWNCYSDTLYFEVIDTNLSYTASSAIVQSYVEPQTTYTGGNPAVITNPGTVHFLATYPTNGCSTEFEQPVSMDTLAPHVDVIGLTPQDSLIFDTLSCWHTSTTMNLFSNDSDVQPYWIYDNDTLSAPLIINTDDQYYSPADTTGANVIFVTYFYGALDSANGCSTPNPYPVGIAFDIKPPLFNPYSGDSTFSCSADSLVLTHDEVLLMSSQGWITYDSDPLNDTLITQSAYSDGVHVYQITGDNGCQSFDTVTVDQNLQLEFEPLDDFWVCPGDTFTVLAQAIGNGTMGYLWSNGTTTQQTSGIGGVDTYFEVTATDGTCSGTESVLVQITPPIVATFVAYQECGNNGSIQVDTVYGGAASNITDYEYAFNGDTTFNTINYFPVDSFAVYPIAIRDTLGCIYEFQTVIEGEILTPNCNFLASTYNVVNDTVFIVDVTLFQGFDSVSWTSPDNVTFIDASNNNTMVTSPDSGWVEIRYTGFIYDTISVSPIDVDTCSYPFSKWLYFGEFGAQLDTSAVVNGINNPTVFPNPSVSGSQDITVTFELGTEQTYFIFTTNTLGDDIPELFATGETEGLVEHTFTLPNLATGTYHIHILSEYGERQLKLVVQ